MDLYCHKHDTIHVMHQAAVERLVYQYQFRIAEAALAKPLPQNNPLTSLSNLVKNGFCPLEDAQDKTPNTRNWRSHTDKTLGRRRYLKNLTSQAKARRTRLANRGKEIVQDEH